MFCPDKNVIFRRLLFRFLKILNFHRFSHVNHCFHDVQYHLIIIIDGLKSGKSNIFARQIKHIGFLVLNSGLDLRHMQVMKWTLQKERVKNIGWSRDCKGCKMRGCRIEFSLEWNDFENSSCSFCCCFCSFIRRVLRTPTLTPKRSVRVPQVLFQN